jgi:hypothetical protein
VRIAQSRESDRFTKNPNNWLREGRWADRPAGVTIDEHGNVVVQQKQEEPDEFLAHILEKYPGNRWEQ